MFKQFVFIQAIIFYLFPLNARAQILSVEQLTVFPFSTAERISSELVKDGWKPHNIEFVPDSNFIRRSWEIDHQKSGVKWYFLFYEFTKDTSENYIIYQFSDKDALNTYRKELKNAGYKLLNPEKKKRRRKSSGSLKKEKSDLFYNEERHTLTVVKEVFLYGLYSFLVYSYKPHSAIAKHVIHVKTNIEID